MTSITSFIKDPAYYFLRFLADVLITVFYSHIEVEGTQYIPKDGPVIFCGTHPNALVDPLLVMAFCPRIIRLVAKDQLFKLPVLRTLLKWIGAVPVMRAQDHANQQQDNSKAFDKLFDALRRGECVAIFPEGTTVFEPKMRPIKTGAARMAFGYIERNPTYPIKIIPVGLNYMERNKFRSKVLVVFGTPIVVNHDAFVQYQDQPALAVRQLTDRIQSSLEALTINAPDWTTLRNIQLAKNLYKPESVNLTVAQEVELTRRFILFYNNILQQRSRNYNNQTPEKNQAGQLEFTPTQIQKVFALQSEIQNYQMKLDLLELTDNDVISKKQGSNVMKRSYNAVIVWPLALLGSILNGPIALLSTFLGKQLARGEIVEEATYKLMVAMGTLAVFYTAIPIAAAKLRGPFWGIFLALLLPTTGFAAASVRPVGSAISYLKSIMKVIPRDLKEERNGLVVKVRNLVDEILDKNYPRMFVYH